MNNTNISPQFVLASASTARLKLLRMVGLEPIVHISKFDEDQIQIEEAEELVKTLARCKAETVAPLFDGALVLGCDSVLTVNGRIYGKPDSPQVAITRWRGMRGKVGEIYTGHALVDLKQQRQIILCGITKVHFANLSDRTIEAYICLLYTSPSPRD